MSATVRFLVCYSSWFLPGPVPPTRARLPLLEPPLSMGLPPHVSDGVLVISDGRVRSVGTRSAVTLPDDAEIISVEGKTIMPGLINAHGHVGATVGLDANADPALRIYSGSCVCMPATASLQSTVSGEMRQPGLRCATSSTGPTNRARLLWQAVSLPETMRSLYAIR